MAGAGGTGYREWVQPRYQEPERGADELGDPVELLREYERIRAEAAATREALKRELMASLGTPSSGKKK